MKYSKNLLLINLVHNKDGKSTKAAIAVSSGVNTKKHQCPWIKLHAVLILTPHLKMRHHDSPASWSGNREGSVCSILPQSSPVIREQEGLKDGRSASGKPGGFLAAPKFLSGAFCSHESHWNKAWTRTGFPSGEHLWVRHTALTFPPSTISNGHHALQTRHCSWQACLEQEALQPSASSHLNNLCQGSDFSSGTEKESPAFLAASAFSPSVQKAHENPPQANSTGSKGCGRWSHLGCDQTGKHSKTWPSQGFSQGIQLTGLIHRIASIGTPSRGSYPSSNTLSPSAQLSSFNSLGL